MTLRGLCGRGVSRALAKPVWAPRHPPPHEAPAPREPAAALARGTSPRVGLCSVLAPDTRHEPDAGSPLPLAARRSRRLRQSSTRLCPPRAAVASPGGAGGPSGWRSSGSSGRPRRARASCAPLWSLARPSQGSVSRVIPCPPQRGGRRGTQPSADKSRTEAVAPLAGPVLNLPQTSLAGTPDLPQPVTSPSGLGSGGPSIRRGQGVLGHLPLPLELPLPPGAPGSQDGALLVRQ